MKLSNFDQWLTSEPSWRTESSLHLVTKDNMTERGAACHIDEVFCTECDCGVGWSSDGTFGEFMTDDDETVYLCEDCTPTD